MGTGGEHDGIRLDPARPDRGDWCRLQRCTLVGAQCARPRPVTLRLTGSPSAALGGPPWFAENLAEKFEKSSAKTDHSYRPLSREQNGSLTPFGISPFGKLTAGSADSRSASASL